MKTKFYTTAESGQTNRRKQKNLNENSMFNVKNVSLMKKQVLKIMMVLALGVGLGTNAWGQGLPTNPDIHFTGSEHTYTVSDNSGIGNTYSWAILTAAGSPLVSGAAADAGHYSITGNSDENSFTFEWTPAASGNYCVQITESNEASRGSCSTVREYFVLVIDFDLHLYASLADGTEISDAGDLATCGANADYNPWFNDVADLTAVTTASSTYDPPATHSSRYFTATITPSAGIDFASVDYRWYFPFTITGGDDTYDITITPVNHASAVTVAYTDYQTGNVTVELESEATITSVTFEIQYEAKWANDESDIQLTVNNAQNTCMLDGTDADNLFDDGTESTANYGNDPDVADPASNVTRTQTIYVSPATSIITLSE